MRTCLSMVFDTLACLFVPSASAWESSRTSSGTQNTGFFKSPLPHWRSGTIYNASSTAQVWIHRPAPPPIRHGMSTSHGTFEPRTSSRGRRQKFNIPKKRKKSVLDCKSCYYLPVHIFFVLINVYCFVVVCKAHWKCSEAVKGGRRLFKELIF